MFQPKQNVCKWANSFKEGRTSVADGERIVATVSDWLRHQSKDFYGEGYRPFWLLFPRWFAHLFGPGTWKGSNYHSRSRNGPNGPKGPKFKNKMGREYGSLCTDGRSV